MAFVLSEEQAEFRDTLRRFFLETTPSAEVRRLMDTADGYDANIWSTMAEELGLQGVPFDEQYGGQGFGLDELCIVAGELGRALVPCPYFASVVLAGGVVRHLASEIQREELLPRIATGTVATLALVEPGQGCWDATGVRMEVPPEADGVRLTGTKDIVIDGLTAEIVLVVTRSPGTTGFEGLSVHWLEVPADGLQRTALQSLDATRKLARLHFDDVRAHPLGEPGQAGPGLQSALDEARVALCAEMLGGMEFVHETTVDYARSRHQFGRSIGSFQAIKHKCANVLIDLEGARAAICAARDAVGDDEFPLLASIAKAHCSDAYYRATQENVQIHGGVGFTWEYDAHLYLRRAKSSQQLLGDANHHRERIATALEAIA